MLHCVVGTSNATIKGCVMILYSHVSTSFATLFSKDVSTILDNTVIV